MLNRLLPGQRRLIKIIGQLAEDSDYQAYLVGGVVRDLLMGKKNLDLDIVIEGDGLGFARKLALKIKAEIVSHQRFGTATLRLSDNSRIDIATARKEIYEFPGALPKVAAGIIEDDLWRRDFSVNAMAVSLNPARMGEIVDFCGGLEDLEKERIRVLHNLSFIDDPTRILRAIRFKERFNFSFEQSTAELLREAFKQKVFTSLKSPRLFAEIVKLLKEGNPRINILAIDRLCKWNFINPKIKINSDLLARIDQQIKWFKSQSFKERLDTWLIYLMALLDSLSRKDKAKLLADFNLKTEDRKRILGCDISLLKFLRSKVISISQVYRVLSPLSCESILFLKAKNQSQLADFRMAEFLGKYSHVNLSISGTDLRRIGFGQDKKIGRVLFEALVAKIDGRLKNRNDELRFCKRLL